MLKIEKLNKYFYKGKRNQIHSINNTTLEFNNSGIVALLGASGSGKTTLLNVIGGLDKADKGKIYINGKKITKRTNTHKVDKIRNLNIGYIFQDYKLIENYSVFDNVAIALKMIGIKDKKEIVKRVNYVLESVKMYRYRNRPAKMLSGGERQRVAIARAIVKSPNIIIADEPTGNLDSKNSLEVMNIIKEISKNKLIILVTHEVELAKIYASRIIEIQDGKVINDYENKELSKNTKEQSSYNLDELKNNKVKYSSINGIFKSIINGFKKIANYSTMKKILLIGYFASAMFVVYSVSNISGTMKINEADFITKNKNYLQAEVGKINVDDFLKYEQEEGVEYILPGNSLVSFKMKFEEYYQTADSYLEITGSLTDINEISSEELIYGKMPENRNEIVIDKMVLDKVEGIGFSNGYTYVNGSVLTEVGLKSIQDILNKKIAVDNIEDFIIVGITDKISPSIYMYKENFINILNNVADGSNMHLFYTNQEEQLTEKIMDYSLYLDDITLKKGKMPENDYEVIVNIANKDQMKLNKTIKDKVNNVELKVVGYYESKTNKQNYFVNNNTIKYNVIENRGSFVIYAKDKEAVLNKFKNEYNLNIVDTYEKDRQTYIKERQEEVTSNIIFSIIILFISLIEIFLMIRSSFLSRIKEIGILRAIGVKKLDIYRMFIGEILAITTAASMPGIIFMVYILNTLIKNPDMSKMFIMNWNIIGLSTLIIYGFNLIIGLIPLYNIVADTPAKIFARHDIE